MAASSIFTNIKITDPKQAELIVNEMEASAKNQEKVSSMPVKPSLTVQEEIRKLMAKRIKNDERFKKVRNSWTGGS